MARFIRCSWSITSLLMVTAPTKASGPDTIWKTNAHDSSVLTVALSPNGSLLASGGLDNGLFSAVKLWRTSDGALVWERRLSHEDVAAVAFSPDGLVLASGGVGGQDQDEGRTRIWQVSDGYLVHQTGGGCSVNTVAFSPDGLLLALGNAQGYINVLRVSDAFGLGSNDNPAHEGGVAAVQFAAHGPLLASGGADGTAKIWTYTNSFNGFSDNSLSGTFSDHSAGVSSVGFLPDGTQLASASYDSTIIMRRVADGFVTRRFQDSNAVVSMAISSDGKLLLAASNNLKFWRISDGTLLQTYSEETEVTSVAICSTGKYFAYGRTDGAVVVARMPVLMESASQSSGEITFHWQGGSGLYQVQARNSFDSGSWQNLGTPTTNTVFTHTCLSPIFYRVQSLPNP